MSNGVHDRWSEEIDRNEHWRPKCGLDVMSGRHYVMCSLHSVVSANSTRTFPVAREDSPPYRWFPASSLQLGYPKGWTAVRFAPPSPRRPVRGGRAVVDRLGRWPSHPTEADWTLQTQA